MPLFVRSVVYGALLTAAIQSAAAMAQDDPVIDPELINLLIESNYQKPASQATAAERASIVEEAKNLYIVSDQPRAIELSKSPRLRAQIELSRRAAIFQAFAGDYIAAHPATDAEISSAYEEQIALSPKNELKARHIIVATQGEATEIIESLKANADFAELAKNKSTGPSGPKGGDLGWFTPQTMVKPFADAIVALEDGQFTESPVQTRFGWHVILREDSRGINPPPLDSVRDLIKQNIEQRKFQEYVQDLRANVGRTP